MKRLTTRCDGRPALAQGNKERFTEPSLFFMLLNRLAAYEDTGLEPEEIDSVFIHSVIEENRRLKEFAQAEKDGRLVVLPCKPGDELARNGLTFKADHWNVLLTAFADDASATLGKRVKLFYPEEAEAALKKREAARDD